MGGFQAKKRELKGVQTKNIASLNESVIRKVGDRYVAQIPIYDRQTDRLLLKEGGIINEERFERMRDELFASLRKKKTSPYYTEKETQEVEFELP